MEIHSERLNIECFMSRDPLDSLQQNMHADDGFRGCSYQQHHECVILLAGLIEQRDALPLLKLIESIGDWPVAAEDWNTTKGGNTSKLPHRCLQLVLNNCANATPPHKGAFTFLNKSISSCTESGAIFTLSELLSLSFAGWMERLAEAVELESVMSGQRNSPHPGL